jgi:hypothetical protein
VQSLFTSRTRRIGDEITLNINAGLEKEREQISKNIEEKVSQIDDLRENIRNTLLMVENLETEINLLKNKRTLYSVLIRVNNAYEKEEENDSSN